MTLDPAISRILTLGLALLFGVAAAHKLADRGRFLGVLANYELTPARLVAPAGMAIVGAEIVAALLLMLPPARAPGVYLSVTLLGCYALAIAVNLLRGRTRIDCGCLGFGRQDRIGWAMVVRNVALIVLALTTLLPASPRELSALDWLTIGASLVTFAVLAATLAHLGAAATSGGGAR